MLIKLGSLTGNIREFSTDKAYMNTKSKHAIEEHQIRRCLCFSHAQSRRKLKQEIAADA